MNSTYLKVFNPANFVGLALTLLLTVSQSFATEIATDTAVLRWLDKVTGRVNSLEAWVGDEVKIGSLSIEVQTCITHPPEETPESFAFLRVWENKPSEPAVVVFSGWMFASSPALSSLDHAVFDVWVLDCKNRRRSISE